MGNQGMTNWKLTALFAISLMLIAGLFSNAAIARDGAGTASVTWTAAPPDGYGTDGGTTLAVDFRDNDVLYEYGTLGSLVIPLPLPAGSTENQLRFSYRVTTNMAGGQVEFRLPSGWTIHQTAANKDKPLSAYLRYDAALLVEVREKFGGATGATPLLIYGLNKDGKIASEAGLELADTSDAYKDQAARVAAITATSITINLSNEWRSEAELVVVLRNVQTAVPRSLGSKTTEDDSGSGNAGIFYHRYPIRVSSKKSGGLDPLDSINVDLDGVGDPIIGSDEYTSQLGIRVGNILGVYDDGDDDTITIDVIDYYGPDTIKREFTIDPEKVYEGETNRTYDVEFEAGGPMYSTRDAADADFAQPVEIRVTVPDQLGDPTPDNIRVTTRGRVFPGGILGILDDEPADTAPPVVITEVTDGTLVTITLDYINDGATVLLTYNSAEETVVRVPDPNPEGSAFTIQTRVPENDGTTGDLINVTSVTGGQILAKAGSGTMVFKDNQVEAGDNNQTLTLIYKAPTPLDDYILEIDVKGIQLALADDDPDTAPEIGPLQAAADGSNKYGYVSWSGSSGTSFNPERPDFDVGTDTDDDDLPMTTITWEGLTFTKAGQTFTTTIKNVTIQEDGANPTFNTRIGLATPTLAVADEVDKSPILYITKTESGAVEFKIDDSNYKSFSAAEELPKIVFTFKAIDTSIKDGQVRFTLPNGWTSAATPSEDEKLDALGELSISGGDFQIKKTADKPKTRVTAGRTVTVGVPELAQGGSITITINQGLTGDNEIALPVTVQSDATEEGKPETITGLFWTSSPISGRGYNAGTVEVEITNAADGYGTATISPSSVRAGSVNERITAEFTAAGSMDGGAVRLVIPEEWGDLQDDDATEANYVEVDVRGRGKVTNASVANRAATATLEGVVKGSVVRFSYGGGTVSSRNGAQVQPKIAVAEPARFKIYSDGDGDGAFELVIGAQRTKALKDADKEEDRVALGVVYRDQPPGVLRVEVTGADDGSGTVEVEIVATGQGEQDYPDDEDLDGDRDRTELVAGYRIHAGDTGTYLQFTYTPSQTIEDGQLKFKVLGEWSKPHNNPGTAGYTELHDTGTADIDLVEFDESDGSVTLDIASIDSAGTIEIHYGVGGDDGSGAEAPLEASTSSAFTIQVKGGDATTNRFRSIKTLTGEPIAVRVYSQASGGGNASANESDNKGDVGAGDANREVTIVYTAAGEISGGSLKLTIPAGWSRPLMSNVAITSTGSVGASSASDFGGYYAGEDLDDVADDIDFPVNAADVALLGAMDVTVDSVNLDAGDTVTFVYSAAMVQPGTGNAAFAVAVDGGSGPGEVPKGVTADPSDATTVSVGDASPGSGSGMLVLAQAVTINSPGNTLTFIYTPTGAIADRSLDIRVEVPRGWSPPTDEETDSAKGSFTVTHKKLDGEVLRLQTAAKAAVEKIGPFDRQMAARLKSGQSLAAGDQVVFTYENADAPATIGASTFVMFYGAEEVETDGALTVLVGSGKVAAMLMVDVSADMILMEDDESVTVTVMLRDEDGNDAPATEDMDVDLESSSATGSFMVDGVEMDVVTITAGSSSAMASYTDSMLGEATITASSGTLTDGTATVTVTTDVVEITSATVAPTVAMAGDMVTVSATGTTGKTATFSVGSIVTDGTMMEDETGSYSGSFAVVVDQHADGNYDITVNLNGESTMLTGALTIDSTAPTVTVSDIEGMVANGDTVMISAMVDDGAGSGVSSVMADVSMLDSTQTDMVALMMADGAYSAEVMISEDNAAMNGEQTITVTAMDAAGNSGMGSTTAELMNTLSFTSMIPAGISLFHVPLDVEGLDTVGDLETMLGNNVNLLITYDGTSWNSRSDDVMITATLGILVSLSAETSVTFEGHAWGDGSSMISLQAGSNLIGLPVDVEGVDMISDIKGLFDQGVVTNIIVSSGGGFQLVAAAGDAADGPVAGDAAYLVMASAAASAAVMGDGWMNGEMAGAAPIALAGYTVDNQTPVLDVLGSVVDEITGLAKEGFRVKAKNLSTKAALSNVTSVEATDGYNMTFVDLADSYAARVGDVLEISADSPDPLLGIKPVRHIVTVDDVKNSRIQLEDLIAYEIPAETELLRNYPNPFNPETWIPYRLAEDANVSLTIYDTSGALVRSIDIGHQTAAVYETRAKAIYWDGRNQFGEQVASGLYFYHLSAGDDFSGTRRMVILK